MSTSSKQQQQEQQKIEIENGNCPGPIPDIESNTSHLHNQREINNKEMWKSTNYTNNSVLNAEDFISDSDFFEEKLNINLSEKAHNKPSTPVKMSVRDATMALYKSLNASDHI